MYDLIIKGGFLIDPHQNIKEEFDVGIKDGVVAAIEKDIDERDGKKSLGAQNKIVVPGFVDLHTHVYWGVSHYGVHPDPNCLSHGVTTTVDAGTSGALNFPAFRKYVIETSKTDIVPFLHISSIGLGLKDGLGELEDFRNLDFNKCIEVVNDNRDIIKGIKIRVDKAKELGPQALILSKECAKKVRLPLMVHPGGLPKNLYVTEILSVLDNGDILTHCFPPARARTSQDNLYPLIMDRHGKIFDEVWKAQEKGVVFDVGHGRGSFSFKTAENALKQGFVPTVISTDLHSHCINHPVYDMPTTLSKFLQLGMSIDNVIKLGTVAPSKVLGMENGIGSLRKGAKGDAVIIDVKNGDFSFWDSINEQRTGKQKIKVVSVIKDGEIYNKAPM